MAIETSSPAAPSTAVVRAAAAALAALSADSIPAKSDAAEVISSCAAITNDMSDNPLARRADLDETRHRGTGARAARPVGGHGAVPLCGSVRVLRNPHS